MIQLISQTQVELTSPCPCKTGASRAHPAWIGLKTASLLHKSVKQHISQIAKQYLLQEFDKF